MYIYIYMYIGTNIYLNTSYVTKDAKDTKKEGKK